jgi:predicted DNA-binding transcriptional regulator YafY
MEDPTARTMELLSLLQGGRPWSGRELADRLGVSARTLRRDVDRLRRLGHPVTSSRGTGGSYRLAPGHAVPPLPQTQEEAIATAVGLRHVSAAAGDTGDEAGPATTALGKFTRALPARTRARVESVVAATGTADHDGDGWDPALFGLLSSAARSRSHVRLRHVGRDGRESERRAEPYRLVLFAHRWYLVAWDLERRDWRRFRVDRIREVRVPGTTFVPRDVPGPHDHRFGARPAGSVLFLAPATTVAPRLVARAGVLEEAGEDRCRYTTGPDDWDWLAGVVAAVAVPYVIEFPDDLAAAARRMAGRALAAVPYASGTPDPPETARAERPAGRRATASP